MQGCYDESNITIALENLINKAVRKFQFNRASADEVPIAQSEEKGGTTSQPEGSESP